MQSPKCQDVHDAQTPVYSEGRGCHLSESSFGPITRQNIHQAICILRRLFRNGHIILGHAYCAEGGGGVQDPVCDAATA